MQFEVSPLQDGVQLFKLAGRLDMKGTNEIHDQFVFKAGAPKDNAIVDMSEVDFLASIGMRMLISAARSKSNRNLKLILVSPTPLVKEALTKAGFDQLIPITDDMDSALAMLN
jgi:anti-sigma B factor antagonist